MFFKPDLTAFNVDGEREFHHWHPGSETTATASQLYSFLMGEWAVSQRVTREEVRFRGGRRTWIYTFTLRRNHDYLTMPVQSNPAVERFIFTTAFLVSEKRHEAQVLPFAANA